MIVLLALGVAGLAIFGARIEPTVTIVEVPLSDDAFAQ